MYTLYPKRREESNYIVLHIKVDLIKEWCT